VAEAFGARCVILLKDVDGLYTLDPKKHPDARLIREIHADELRDMQLPTLPIEPVILDLIRVAKSVKSIRLVNGLKRGSLSLALSEESVGTLIHA
jgi:molybdenum storage protein